MLHPIIRQQIFHLWQQGKTAAEIHELISQLSPDATTKGYIANRLHFFATSSAQAVADYVTGARIGNAGAKRKYDESDDAFVQHIIDQKCTLRLQHILQKFCEWKGIHPSESSISAMYRAQKRIEYSRKALSRECSRKDEAAMLLVLQDMAHIPPENILCFDAASTESGENLKEGFGRSRVGEPAIRHEYIIKNESWCVFGLYSTLGFLCWRFYKGTGADNECVRKFLEVDCVQFVINDNDTEWLRNRSRLRIKDPRPRIKVTSGSVGAEVSICGCGGHLGADSSETFLQAPDEKEYFASASIWACAQGH